MAVGESVWPEIFPVKGMRLGVAAAGVKYPGRKDLVLIELQEGATTAGVFTRNAFCAAPVTIAREHLAASATRYALINSGNANACTGSAGRDAAFHTLRAVAGHGNVAIESVLPFSTGVIGELLPAERIAAAVPNAFGDLSEDGWERAARAIMTTDTRPKAASVRVEIDGKTVSITGIAKGAGMIRPNMGTMLAYIGTDASVDNETLDVISRNAANRSFNRITIDGDTSTNDACMLFATGASGAEVSTSEDSAFALLQAAVIEVYQSLAQQIVRDGEGATKFVTVDVRGGATADESLKVAYGIAHSPLVKTAMFASDPNWGRIVAAIGNADVLELDAGKVSVWLDDVAIVSNGGRAASYEEALGQAIFNLSEFTIAVDLGRGDARELIWTSDLSHEYVTINAEYRT